MIGLLLTGLLLTQTPAVTNPTPPAPQAAPVTPAAPALSELHQAQVDAHLLRLRNLQLQVQLEQLALSQQRSELEAAITKTYVGFAIDWTKGQLVPVPTKEGTPRGQ